VRKLYTVAEANRTLPYVSAIVEEVRERYQVVRDRGREHNALPPDDARRAELKVEVREAADRIRACLDELQALAVEIKDYDEGLVDFPAELEGRPILLCWRLGEERVGFWHEIEAGARGRRPVADDPNWPPVPAPAKGKPPKSPKPS
jgi:hypothetical protein